MNVLEKILEEIDDIYVDDIAGYGVECNLEERTNLPCNNCYECIKDVCKAIICKHMNETISEMEKVEKEKVTSAEIITRQIDGKPYYHIKFKKVGEDEYTIGYSSFKLDYVVKWLNEYFEFCGEAKVSCDNEGWISVEERLPNQNGVYNITRLIDDVFISDSAYFDGKDTWHNDNRVNHIRPYLTDIVAWQPFPTRYIPPVISKQSQDLRDREEFFTLYT